MPSSIKPNETIVHPSAEQLAAFARGRLNDAELDRIESHLDECPSCCEALAGISHQEDRFVAELVSAAKESDLAVTAARGDTPGRGDETVPVQKLLQPPPRTIGRFRVRGQIGHGGFGVVLLADDPQLRREVAVKIPRLGALLTPELHERFLREAQAAAALDHPNIVPIHEAGDADGVCYIASRYCPGPNLSAWLKEQTLPVGFDSAAGLVAQLADAIAHAHSRGVLHRDLKPSNVLLESKDDGGCLRGEAPLLSSGADANSFVPKITDFGLAKLDDGPDTTRSNVVMGTVGYMSPEQARGKAKEITESSDIYSLGAILYEMLVGRPPLVGETDLETLQRVQSEEPIPPARLRPKLPRDLETICLTCLAKEPRRRYGSATMLRDDLQRFLRGEPIHARRTSRIDHTWRWCRRNPALAAMSGCALLLLAALVFGSVVSSIWLREQQRKTFAQLQETTKARGEAEAAESRAAREEQSAKRELFASLLAKARAMRMAGRAGQKFDSMRSLEEAAELVRTLGLSSADQLKLRNEVIACLPLIDARVDRVWRGDRPNSVGFGSAFDADVARYATIESDGRLVVRRIADNGELCRIDINAPHSRPPGWWLILRFSPDGNYIAARGERHASQLIPTRVWDIRTGELAAEPFPLSHLHHGFDFDFDFSPDSRSAAVGRPDGSVAVVTLESGESRTLLSAGAPPRNLRFDPLGKRLAVCRAGETHVVDVESGEEQLKLTPEARFMAWSSDGEWLAAGSGGDVTVWNSHSGARRARFDAQQGSLVALYFLPGSCTLVTTSWADTRLWTALSGQRSLLVERGEAISASRDGRRLGLGLRSDIGRFEVALPDGFRTIDEKVSAYNSCLEISADGRLLLAADIDRVLLWHARTGRKIGSIALPRGSGEVHAHFDASGESIFTLAKSRLYRWPIRWDQDDSTDGAVTARLIVGPPQPLSLTSPMEAKGFLRTSDGRLLLADDYEVRVLDVSGDQPTVEARVRHAGFWMASSSDRRWLATSRFHGLGTRVWDLTTGRRIQTLDGMSATVAFSPDDQTLIVGNSGRYDVYETGSWRQLRTIATGNAVAPSYSQDGSLLAVSANHHAINLLDGRTLAELASFVPPAMERVSTICLSPDGNQLVAKTVNGIIHVWELPDIRGRLARLGLDWKDAARDPSFSPAESATQLDGSAVALEVQMGELLDVERLGALLAEGPDNAALYVERGQAHLRFGRAAEALRDFTRAVELDPAHVDAHFQRGRVLAQHKSYEEAVASFARAIELSPDHAEAHHQRGHARQALKKWDDALADYTRAGQLQPDEWKLHEHQGNMFVQLRQWDAALHAFGKAIERAHDAWDRSQCYDRRAAVHSRLGNDAEALADTRQALELDWENYGRSNALAWGLATVSDPHLRDPEQAVELARYSLDLNRENGMAWNTLGVAHFRHGDFDLALEAFGESMQLRQGGDAYDWLFVAMCHQRQGDVAEARRWFDKSIEWLAAQSAVDRELEWFRDEAEAVIGMGHAAP